MAFDGDKATTSICFEPTVANGIENGSNDSNYIIGQILYIDSDNIYLYKRTSSTGDVKVYSCKSSDCSSYDWQQLLAWAYDSQSNYNYADDFAMYLRTEKDWRNATNEALDTNITFNDKNPNTKSKYSRHYRSDSYYKYTGVFVFFAENFGSGQGTMAYRVVREPKTQPITLNLRKQDFNGNSLSGATFTIQGIENVASIDNSELTIGEGSIQITPTSNSGYFKIRLTETKEPTGYSGIRCYLLESIL